MLHTHIMNFAHIADLQLGCNRFDGRLSRRREQDFYDAWNMAARYLADQEEIEFVVIVGDVFEYPTPSTAARLAFQQGLLQLTNADKHVLIVSGNHETPRSAETTHPLALYNDFEKVTVAFENTRSIFGFRLVPWIWGQPIDLGDFEYDDDVLVVHAACPVLEAYRNIGERVFLPEMGKNYKYVALGDYHVQTQVADNAWYSGSLEHTSFSEADASTGGWIVSVEDGKLARHERFGIYSRPMKNIHVKKGHEKRLKTILKSVEKEPDAMYRLILHGVEPSQIDPMLLSELRNAGMFVKIVFQDRPGPPDLVEFGPQNLRSQWEMFCDHADYSAQIVDLGVEILEEVIANG